MTVDDQGSLKERLSRKTWHPRFCEVFVFACGTNK